MDKSLAHYTKWKKSDSKGNILYDPIYMTFPKRQNCRDRKQCSGCQNLAVEGGVYYKEVEWNFGGS